ncbi:sce7726 family protein [Butyrivibrio sp. XBB1001]|uniref:sce7726 family protein n=1 Tax=Butyrivibrio sp. XBB1001 TaxID=1280682 RepID=UPI0003F8B761|nr:sce7726 family protein [Butyrivibrio sp. XBB1001]
MLKDKDIREPFFDFLEDTYGKVRIIEEKTMGRSRADLVMVTEDSLVGIEIKSDADTYARLVTQVKDYDKYYDYNIAVVGSSHGIHIKEHVPVHWGIITVEEVDGVPDFYMLRKPETNPNMKLENKLKILWRPELALIQEKYGMAKYKEKSKSFVIDKISALVPDIVTMEALSGTISNILFERDYSKVAETLTEYRKGELQKAIEKETDPKKKLELMVEQAEKSNNFTKKTKRRRRRR